MIEIDNEAMYFSDPHLGTVRISIDIIGDALTEPGRVLPDDQRKRRAAATLLMKVATELTEEAR